MSDSWTLLPRVLNHDGSVKHVVCDGSRDHVVSWSTEGEHCSVTDCEINRRREALREKQEGSDGR